MVVRFVETFSTSILLILLAIYILHLIRGDATQWLMSKFTVFDADNPTKLKGTLKGGMDQ